MKVALIHDYLREYGGAERVLECLHDIFPDAPVYTAFVDQKALGIHWQKFQTWNIKETWISDIPLYKKLYSPLRLFAPAAFKDLDLHEFDVVISSSNAYFSKAVQVPNGTHICYCHTPARSLYGYSTMSDWRANPITRVGGALINHYLRMVDFEVAQKVDVFIANSQETQRRITKFYRRDSQIIYPPVMVPEKIDNKQRERALQNGYLLYVNRLAFAKHPEIAVAACSKLQVPLKVVGTGKMLSQLKEAANSNVEFLGSVSDEKLSQLYDGAKALLYPVEDEDFGIVPVEAMGRGVPVIAHNSGGPRETILDQKTGVLFDDLSVDGLSAAIQEAEKIHFKPEVLHSHAKLFSIAHFQKKIRDLLIKKTDKFQKNK